MHVPLICMMNLSLSLKPSHIRVVRIMSSRLAVLIRSIYRVYVLIGMPCVLPARLAYVRGYLHCVGHAEQHMDMPVWDAEETCIASPPMHHAAINSSQSNQCLRNATLCQCTSDYKYAAKPE